MRRRTRTLTAAALTGILLVGGAACSDEDGDGATTDEEVGDLEQEVEDGGEQLEEEVNQGEEEIESDE